MDEQPAELLLPPPRPSNKLPFFLGGLLIFLLAGLVIAYFSTKNRIVFQKKAIAPPNNLACKRWSGGWPAGYQSPYGSTEGKINFFSIGLQPGEEVKYRCDYRKALEKAGGNIANIRCDDEVEGVFKEYRVLGCPGTVPENACYTAGVDSFIDPNFMDGKCQVVQIDLTGCSEAIPAQYPSYPGWAGGVAFIIAYNGECPESTPTPTPAPPAASGTPTPTPMATPVPPSCSGLTLSRGTITLGQSVTVTASFSNYGYLRYGLCSAGSPNCIVADSTNPTTLTFGNTPISTSFTPSSAGSYVLEVNAYESSACLYLCSAGAIYYRNNSGGNCLSTNWTRLGACISTNCRKWLTVSALTPTPTSTPRPTGTPTPTVTSTPTPTPGAGCVLLEAFKVNADGSLEELVDLKIGDVIRFVITTSQTPEKAAVRIIKDEEIVFTGLAEKVPLFDEWILNYTLTSGGDFEAIGYIKTGGIWK